MNINKIRITRTELNPYLRGNLKKLRKNYSLSQKTIACDLGLERSTYTYYETGKNEPPLYILSKIIEFYNKNFSLNIGYDDILASELDFMVLRQKRLTGLDSKKILLNQIGSEINVKNNI